MFDRIEFIISEAMASLRRNVLMVVAATVTVAVSLVLIGGFGYVYFRANQYAESLPSKFEMRVYLKDSVTGTGLNDMARNLGGVPGVGQVTLIPKAQAWAQMKANYPEIPFDLSNPLPDAFNVRFTDLKAADSAAKQIQGFKGVDKVLYQGEILKSIRSGIGLLRYIGFLGILLFLISGIVVYNAILLTIHARKLEIRVMQLVGATNSTIRVPFMLEGMVQGAIGGVLAGLCLDAISFAFGRFTTGLNLAVPQFPVGPVIGILAAIGVVLGLVCSGWAIHAPLKVQAKH